MNNEATKDGVVPFATVVSWNNIGTQDENVGQCSTPIKYTADPNEGNVLINTTSYAKLVIGESSRKSVNFCTLLAPGRNEADVAISLELFFFKFNSKDGMDIILKNGPWIFHGVPITEFSEDRLSIIATKRGTPFMLNSYSSDMCMQSWGMSNYARAMIEF
ncbi:hypothetical protein Tco_1066249 [Tanacetum coccineum]|uniref:DUF4283 domain-containing protein n=1 Tax=Tanacetum coccineum TaxID=301880 RepID=A0ABQ5HBB5_9ASTR